MTPDEIRTELETARSFPEDVLRQAVRHADALAPAVVDVIERAAAGVYLLPRQQRLLYYGLHAVAAGRVTAPYRPLLALLRLSEDELDLFLGDAVTETLTGVLLAVFDGDVEPLISAIEDRSVEGFVRWSLFDVLARLTFDGIVPRELAAAALDRFERERLAEDGDPAWVGWQDAIMLLGLADRADRVRASWEDGRNPQHEGDKEYWEQGLRKACDDPTDPQRFAEAGAVPLDDPVAALARFDGGDDAPAPPEPEDDKPKRRDPAAAIRLDTEEIDWLAGFLVSVQVPESTMSLEELDGFLTALVVGPERVLPSEYMPHIWGGDGEGPVFDSREQREYVAALLTRHWNAVATRLDEPYPHMPLIWRRHDTEDGRYWASGFMRGVQLRWDAWQPLIEDERYYAFFAPIMMLETDDPSNAYKAATAEERRKCIEALPLSILGMHEYWRKRQTRRGRSAPVKRRKVGRNEPCPCGSGRKYKVCCGR